MRWDKMKNKDFQRIQDNLTKMCYIKFQDISNKFLQGNWEEVEKVPEEVLGVILEEDSFKSNKHNFYQFNSIGIYFKLVSETNIMKLESESFRKAIEINSNPTDFFEMVNLKKPTSEVEYKGIDFLNYQSTFFVEKDDENLDKSLQEFSHPNQIFMSLISSSFSLASEAYATIGPLEYVKFKDDFENKTDFISCFSLLEVFMDNFSMMLVHISEEEHFAFLHIKDNQSISDAFSKYLKRAMALFRLECLNAYGVKIGSVLTRGLPRDITSHWVFKFYQSILGFDGPGVKFFCFEKLIEKLDEEFNGDFRVGTMFDSIFRFFMMIYEFIISKMNVKQLFFNKGNRLLVL
jgi:hypothetical protein